MIVAKWQSCTEEGTKEVDSVNMTLLRSYPSSFVRIELNPPRHQNLTCFLFRVHDTVIILCCVQNVLLCIDKQFHDSDLHILQHVHYCWIGYALDTIGRSLLLKRSKVTCQVYRTVFEKNGMSEFVGNGYVFVRISTYLFCDVTAIK